MFENYADHIQRTDVFDVVGYATRIAAHLAGPTGPVRIDTAPGLGTVNTLSQVVLNAGYRFYSAETSMLTPAINDGYITDLLDDETDGAVLVIGISGQTPSERAAELFPALREAAAHPKVHATFVVHTIA